MGINTLKLEVLIELYNSDPVPIHHSYFIKKNRFTPVSELSETKLVEKVEGDKGKGMKEDSLYYQLSPAGLQYVKNLVTLLDGEKINLNPLKR